MSTPLTQTVRIQNDLGLHLRAAGALVQVASRFTAEIKLSRGNTEANAKSIMSVLSLAAGKGMDLVLTAEGEDAAAALAAVAQLIADGFKHP